MANNLNDYVNSILDKVTSDSNLKDCRYTFKKFETIAQNYFGILIPVSVSATKDRKEVNLELVIKLAPSEENRRVSGAVTTMFAREMFVYSTLLEKYRKYQENNPSYLQYTMPECFLVCKDYCKEAIVMQNMCKEGFVPYTQDSFLNFDHITLSLKSLAYFHALSFILKERDPKTFIEVEKTCIPLTEKTNKRFMEILEDRLLKAMIKFECSRYLGVIKDMKDNCVKYIEAATFSVQKTCLCHGDIWKENILFKYENDKPVSACLIDYQTTRICSPAYDVLYLITSSTDSNLRQQCYHELLEVYYDSFKEFLSVANLDSQSIYSKEMFQDDLKTVSPACFIVANTAIWLSNGLQQEGNVQSKLVCKTPEEKEAAITRYKNIIQGIIDDYHRLGYFVLT